MSRLNRKLFTRLWRIKNRGKERLSSRLFHFGSYLRPHFLMVFFSGAVATRGSRQFLCFAQSPRSTKRLVRSRFFFLPLSHFSGRMGQLLRKRGWGRKAEFYKTARTCSAVSVFNDKTVCVPVSMFLKTTSPRAYSSGAI